MSFQVGNKVQLLNSIGDVLYGNRGEIMSEIHDIVTGVTTYEVYFESIQDMVVVHAEDIALYNNPHLTGVFTIERTE